MDVVNSCHASGTNKFENVDVEEIEILEEFDPFFGPVDVNHLRKTELDLRVCDENFYDSDDVFGC